MKGMGHTLGRYCGGRGIERDGPVANRRHLRRCATSVPPNPARRDV